MGILQSALRLKQLALVDAQEPGWKQIVAAPSLAGVASPGLAGGTVGAEGAIAQVFVLNHADPTHTADVIRPFLTQPNGYMQADPARKLIIVCDYASVVRRVQELIQTLDSDGPQPTIRFVPLKQAEATQIVTALTQLVSNRETAQAPIPPRPAFFSPPMNGPIRS